MASISNLGSLRVGVEIPVKNWNKNYGKITGDVKKYPKTTDKALDRAGKAWEKHAGSIKKASLGMVAFGTATVAALGFAVKAAGDFQQSMVNTQSVVGATSEELQELTLFAREMGKQTVFSAKESADAMYSLGSAGLSTKEIMDSLKGTLNLAAATQSDLASTSKTVASTLSQYGLAADQAGRISNVFTATISASQATMDKLATSMSLVGPVARSIGMSLEETTGILGSLFNAGLDASTAGTSLRMSIAQLLKPTDAAKEALGRLKVETLDSGGNLRSLTDIIRDLESTGLSAADALTIFGVRAGPGMLALVSKGADAIEDLTEKVTGTNKAAEIAALQVDTFQGQIKLLKSAFSELQITIGNQLLPVLTDYTTKLSGIINLTSDWAAENPRLTKTLVTLGGIAGTAALALGGIGLAAGGIIKGLGVLKLMAIDVGILAGAIGISGIATAGIAITLVAGLAALALGFKAMIKPSEDASSAIEKFTENVWDSTKGLEANFTALKNVKVEAEALADIFPDVFTGTQIAGVKEFGTAAAITEQTLNTVGERLLLIEKSRKTDMEGQLARTRLTLESMGLESEAIDDLIKKEKQRLEEAVIGSKANIAMFARLEKAVAEYGKAILLNSTHMEFLTGTIQRESDKQVAILKQRTKQETDWVKVNGIIQLGLIEKNVDEILTLHGKETKEIKDARLKAEKEERKARDENLKESVQVADTAAREISLKLVGIGKDRDAALEDLENKRSTNLKKDVDTTNRLMGEVSKAQISAGERAGKALIATTKTTTSEIGEIWNSTAGNIKRATSDLFASMLDPNLKTAWGQLWDSLGQIAIDALADILASQAAQGIARLFDPEGPGAPTTITGAFGRMFGKGAGAAEVFGPPAPPGTIVPTATTQIGAVSSSATLGAITSAALPIAITAGIFFEKRARQAQRELENELRLTKRAVDIQVPIGTLRRLEDIESKVAFLARVQGLSESEIRSILGVATTGERIAAARVFIANQPQLRQARLGQQVASALPEPLRFVPRRPEGTDRFGRPVAATPSMAPGRGGNVTFGDIIVNLPEGADIQNMDSAEWERILRDNIQPAAESIGLRFVRSDNLMAS